MCNLQLKVVSRPPEMCDPYQRYTVDTKVDIWMLGCILYTLCFFKHPFQGTSKLSIINAAFKFPKEHSYPEKLIDIIRLMLTPDPQYRPSIVEIVDIFKNYPSLTSIKLNVSEHFLLLLNQIDSRKHKGLKMKPKKVLKNKKAAVAIKEIYP